MPSRVIQVSEVGFLNPIPRRQQSGGLITFTEALGGAEAEPITNTGDPERPFQVGDDTFDDFKSAARRTCDNQKNACAKIANDDDKSNGLEVSDCDKQRDDCKSAQDKATVTSFDSSASSQAQVVTSDDEFTYFCDP
ncbi:hypothetical protein V498_02970 [Pseudogymnoascus sp. VKM F-4517 (FW-2822)]|nr:hypothetical protein V498_02970 [Pseudogymnoascus sp. VKM F-4517 (FW-2822)]